MSRQTSVAFIPTDTLLAWTSSIGVTLAVETSNGMTVTRQTAGVFVIGFVILVKIGFALFTVRAFGVLLTIQTSSSSAGFGEKIGVEIASLTEFVAIAFTAVAGVLRRTFAPRVVLIEG